MARIVWRPSAQADVDNIRSYIEENAPVYVARVINRIFRTFDGVRQFPFNGAMAPERNSPSIRHAIASFIA